MTTPGDDASVVLPPPTLAEVWFELEELKKREGITPSKVRKAGPTLQRLWISQDEYRRRRGVGVDLAVATVEALKCVVAQYRSSEVARGGYESQNWLILYHELNLDGDFGFGLTERRLAARDRLNGMSEAMYARRSKATLEMFAFKVTTLTRSLCWLDGELEAVETTNILKLSNVEKIHRINFLFMYGKDAYFDKFVTAHVLSATMPNLVEALQQIGVPVTDQPGEILKAVVRAVGGLFYDQYAQLFDRELLHTGGLIFPWDRLHRWIAFDRWLGAKYYVSLAASSDTFLRGLTTWGPLRVSDDHVKQLRMTGKLFFDLQEGEPTDVFWKTLDRSLVILAQLMVEIDNADIWTASSSDEDAKKRAHIEVGNDGFAMDLPFGLLAFVAKALGIDIDIAEYLRSVESPED
ncbi:hypothetical protein Mycsm_01752 [Mycobacterium sp. JS623]|uniref:hypothetical protein n=1 Tax=Mycobacterium sp. JS623 TaxID=212767 RepID=UPI0002A5B4DF|nr:hypothetical protein [Mycobacterium sp. JS623]AGB22145.1 hypothetical protein Mycsm_01752 [Mycobacterium sp. JS623]